MELLVPVRNAALSVAGLKRRQLPVWVLDTMALFLFLSLFLPLPPPPTQTQTHERTRTHAHTHTNTHKQTRTHTRTHTYTHTHTHTHTTYAHRRSRARDCSTKKRDYFHESQVDNLKIIFYYLSRAGRARKSARLISLKPQPPRAQRYAVQAVQAYEML